MTNKQVFALWEDFLCTYCDCYPDKNGNHPCDNGWLCDRCQTPEMQKLFNLVLESAILAVKEGK